MAGNSSQQQCYYTNGNSAASDVACTDGSGNSFCCSNSYQCLSNRLCEWVDGRLYRGSCTDEAWVSGQCPQYCLNINPGGGIRLFACSESEGSYCCGSDNSNSTSCCNDPEAFFVNLPVPATIGQIVDSVFVPESTTSTSATTTLTRTSTSTTTTTSTSSTSSTTSGSSALSSSAIGSSGTSSAPIPTNTNPSDQGGGGSNAGAIAGGVVGGLAVLGILIFAAWWLFVRKRKRTRQENDAGAQDGKQVYPGGPHGDYQKAMQNEYGELDSGQRMIPQEMDSEVQPRQQTAPYELSATYENPR